MRSGSLNLRVPRLGVNRYGVYYVRSSTVDSQGRRRVKQQSLGTKDPLLAKLAALKFSLGLVSEELMSKINPFGQAYEVDLSSGKVKAEGPEDHERAMELVRMLLQGNNLEEMMRRSMPAPTQEPDAYSRTTIAAGNLSGFATQALVQGMASLPKPTNAGIKLKEAMAAHLKEEANVLKLHTLNEKRSIFAEFQAFFGEDIYLNQITKQDITERWRKAEFTRPNQKRTGATLSPNRLEKRRSYLSKFFDWAGGAEGGGQYMHAENPMNQKMAKKKDIRASTASYKEFTTEDISRLFSAQYVLNMDKPDWYWIPLMSLYSGARLGELCTLGISDFEEIDKIKCFYIPHAKTPGGRRTVPIHSKLLELGLWEYRDFLDARSEQKLLWFRPKDKMTKSAGEQWGKWVGKCGITDKSKVFHSFRSTAITDMYDSDAPNAAAIRDTVGHTGGTTGVHGKYIRSAALKRAQASIESLHFPGIEINLLRREDATFSAFYEVEKARLTSDRYAAQKTRRVFQAEMQAKRAAELLKRSKRTR